MERQKMKKKGFTLVELLVVIAIIAMLLAILMPALGKVRQLAQRIMCSTNLAGIGKAMLTYSTDDKYESFPIAGSPGAYWNRGDSGTQPNKGCSWDWRNPNGFPEIITDKFATVSSCLYLLVKYADVSPDQYICPGSDQKKFEISKYSMTGYTGSTFTDVWDFGQKGTTTTDGEKTAGTRGKGHTSYSYQMPLPLITGGTLFPITTTTNPAKAILADMNPFWQSPMGGGSDPVTARLYVWDTVAIKIKPDSIAAGNATFHQKDGQNVLYADQHSKFEKSANCGIESDNIYTVWGKALLNVTGDPLDEALRQCGRGYGTTTPPSEPPTDLQDSPTTTPNANYSLTDMDNYLVNDVDKCN